MMTKCTECGRRLIFIAVCLSLTMSASAGFAQTIEIGPDKELDRDMCMPLVRARQMKEFAACEDSLRKAMAIQTRRKNEQLEKERAEQRQQEQVAREAQKARDDEIRLQGSREREVEAERMRQELAKSNAAVAEEAREKANVAAAIKKKCGPDYNRARVGMSFARIKECSSSRYLLKAEQLTASGEVLRTYRKGNIFVHVISDKVVRAEAL